MKTTIKTLVQEAIHQVLKEAYALEPRDIPAGIRNWVNAVIGSKVKNYRLEQQGEVEIGIPTFEADREEYQMFKLTNGDATPVEGVSFHRSGNEGDGVPVTGLKIGGRAVVPSGHVLVRTSRYLKMATLYTSSDAQQFLPQPTTSDNALNDQELAALHAAKSLKSAYRKKFPPEVYARLMALGYMASNKSVTVNGRNALEAPELKNRIYALSNSAYYQAPY